MFCYINKISNHHHVTIMPFVLPSTKNVKSPKHMTLILSFQIIHIIAIREQNINKMCVSSSKNNHHHSSCINIYNCVRNEMKNEIEILFVWKNAKREIFSFFSSLSQRKPAFKEVCLWYFFFIIWIRLRKKNGMKSTNC